MLGRSASLLMDDLIVCETNTSDSASLFVLTLFEGEKSFKRSVSGERFLRAPVVSDDFSLLGQRVELDLHESKMTSAITRDTFDTF